MKEWCRITIALAVLVSSGFTTGTAGERDCRSSAVKTGDMEECLNQMIASRQKQLETLVAYLRKAAEEESKESEALEQSQAKWEDYRLAECHLVGVLYEGGREKLLRIRACELGMIEDRARALTEMYWPSLPDEFRDATKAPPNAAQDSRPQHNRTE